MTPKKKSPEPRSVNSNRIDLGTVTRVLEFMTQHGLEEFEYEAAGLRLRLKKPSPNSGGAMPRVLAPPEIVVASPATGNPAALGPAQPTAEANPTAVAEDLHIVKSPIVGTFYEAPSPGAAAFVKPGDFVEMGQVLCIVEAMKLMNEIESDVAGEIIRIYVQNGQPVEYGESLFAVRPARKK